MSMTRRSFMGGAVLASAATALAGNGAAGAGKSATLSAWKPGEFRIHALETGVGESQFLIFPDGTTMLIDAGDHAAITRGKYAVPVVPDAGRLAGEWVARFVKRVNPQGDKVDYLETTHWHDDHTGIGTWSTPYVSEELARVRGDFFRSGLGLVAERIHFTKAFDRGTNPMPKPAGELSSYGHMQKVYKYLQKRDGLVVEPFRLGAVDQVKPCHGAAAGFEVFNVCGDGKVARRDGTIHEIERKPAEGRPFDENRFSLGHVFTYGKFKYYTAGDFSDSTQNEDGLEGRAAPLMECVNVAKVSHHGYHGSPRKFVAALRPQLWLACVWDQLHMLPDVMERLADASLYGARGPAEIAPGIFPEPRVTQERGANYFKRLAPEIIGKACHVVITVPPNAAEYRVDFVTAEDESMRITGTRNLAV